jgi:RNA polymerase sigma factor (sigma-70 family)
MNAVPGSPDTRLARFLDQAAPLRAYAYGLTGDMALADDVVQECFLVLSMKAGDLPADLDLAAWTHGVARRKVLELLRFRDRHRSRLPPEAVEALAAEAPPEGDWERDRRRLAACIATLAPRARRMIERRHLEGAALKDLAAEIGWGVDAVQVALSRARSALRRCLARDEQGLPS